MVPPAALAVHLCIGQAYAFSVFNDPLTRLLGISASSPDDWKLTSVGWIFSLAIVFLGLSAAFAGKWLEKVGPRLTMFVAACCFGSGFWLSALGVYWHVLWLVRIDFSNQSNCFIQHYLCNSNSGVRVQRSAQIYWVNSTHAFLYICWLS